MKMLKEPDGRCGNGDKSRDQRRWNEGRVLALGGLKALRSGITTGVKRHKSIAMQNMPNMDPILADITTFNSSETRHKRTVVSHFRFPAALPIPPTERLTSARHLRLHINALYIVSIERLPHIHDPRPANSTSSTQCRFER